MNAWICLQRTRWWRAIIAPAVRKRRWLKSK
jgi:hypothetical protein